MKIKSIEGTVTHSSPGRKPVSRKVVLKLQINNGKPVKSAPKANRKPRKAS